MAGAFGDSMGYGGCGYGAPDPNADAFGAASFGLPQFGNGADFGPGSSSGGGNQYGAAFGGDQYGGGNQFGAASYGDPYQGDGFAGGYGGGFDDSGFGGAKGPEKKSKKDKKWKKNATISDQVLYADPYGQVWGAEGQKANQRHGEDRHRRGDYSFDDNSPYQYGDHVHIKDRYHGVRAYDPWKDIPERPDLEPYYTERLQETLGSDYLPHHRNDLSPKAGASEMLYGGPVLLGGGAADSRAIPTGPSPAGPFLRTIVPAFRDERKPGQSGAGSSALVSPAPVDPMSDLAWWPLPRRAAAARSAASTMGVKLDNFAPGTELWHSVTELTEAFKRATPEADMRVPISTRALPGEAGPTVVRRKSSLSPRRLYSGERFASPVLLRYTNVVRVDTAQPTNSALRPRSSSPPRSRPLQSSRIVSNQLGAGWGLTSPLLDDSRGVPTFSGSSAVRHLISSSATAARPLGSGSVVGITPHERGRSGQLLEQSFSRRPVTTSERRPLLSTNSLASSATSGFAGHPVSAY